MSTKPAEPRVVATTCYLVIEPSHRYDGRLESIRVDRVVTTRPTKLSAKFIALQVNIEVVASLFEQFLPAATVRVNDPRDLIAPVVTVIQPDQADDAGDTLG